MKIVEFGTEYDFRNELPKFKQHPPTLFILGQWFRWTDPAPSMPKPPADWGENGYRTAALRCQRLIHQCPELARTPVIIWSDFDEIWMRETFGNPPPENVHYIRKSSDLDDLIQLIHSVTH